MTAKYLTAPVPTEKLPGGIPYIVGNEAAERFSFYGMKGILTVFMLNYLHLMGRDGNAEAMTNAEATEYYHMFTGAVYFTPIFGAFVSDTFLGKYRTIILLSMVYCVGHLCLGLMGLAGIPAAWWLFMGLSLICIGSGGIKPCVSAHVGDQFGRTNAHWLPIIFAIFYFAINLGASISNFVTPELLRSHGPHLAFGVPGVLMAIATFVFWTGRRKFIHVPPSGTGFFKETFSGEGLSALSRICIVFAFFVTFWALFDQTGSTWILQAEDLNRNWLGREWLPSQIQMANPILVLVFIPLFNFVLYPLVNKVVKVTPIRKIAVGLFVMIGGFGVVTFLQEAIDAGATPSIGWQLVAYAILTASEVMVSITGLEFAYTQAPRSMKSMVMALFFFTVFLGNFFTMGVNSFIQVPNPTKNVTAIHKALFTIEGEPKADWEETVASSKKFKDRQDNEILLSKETVSLEATDETEASESTLYVYQLSGVDGEFDTDDDVTIKYDETGARTNIVTAANDVIDQAQAIVEEHFNANEENLPQTDEGLKLVGDLTDPWGQSLSYRMVNSNTYRITSFGPDKTYMTENDIVLQGKVSRVSDGANGPSDAPYTWRENRIIELRGEKGRKEVEAARGAIQETEISTSPAIGGQTILEGAEYFWFWTKFMTGTAFLFLIVTFFYKSKEYLQEESDKK